MSIAASQNYISGQSLQSREYDKRFKFKLVLRITFLMSVAGFLWAVGMFVIGAYELIVIPVLYLILSAVNMWICTKSKKTSGVYNFQFLISILFPCLFQVIAGGAMAAGFVMIWSMVALLTIGTFSSVSEIIKWTVYTLAVSLAALVFEFSPYYNFQSTIDIPPMNMLVFNIMAAFIVILYIGFFFVSTMERTRNRLAKAIGEVQELNTVLQKKNDSHEQGLIDARDIQATFFKSEDHLRSVFTKMFLLQEAKNYVNGDFIWAEQKGDYKYIISGDCSNKWSSRGLLTMLLVSAVERVFQEKSFTDPGEFLTKLNKRLLENRNLNASNLNLNLCLTMLIINAKTNDAKLATAGGKLFVKKGSDQKVTSYEVSKYCVGAVDAEKRFKSVDIGLEIGDTVYMCTDGFINQTNNTGVKYGIDRFIRFLEGLDTEYAFSQKRSLTKEFNQWVENGAQSDDVLICGFEIEDPKLVYEEIEKLEIYAGVRS